MRYLVVAEQIVKSMRGPASASLLPSHYLYSVFTHYQRFHNSREMFEFYATKSRLFLLKAVYVMGNLSDIMDLLILWRLDALFGCGRANSEVDAWSGER